MRRVSATEHYLCSVNSISLCLSVPPSAEECIIIKSLQCFEMSEQTFQRGMQKRSIIPGAALPSCLWCCLWCAQLGMQGSLNFMVPGQAWHCHDMPATTLRCSCDNTVVLAWQEHILPWSDHCMCWRSSDTSSSHWPCVHIPDILLSWLGIFILQKNTAHSDLSKGFPGQSKQCSLLTFIPTCLFVTKAWLASLQRVRETCKMMILQAGLCLCSSHCMEQNNICLTKPDQGPQTKMWSLTWTSARGESGWTLSEIPSWFLVGRNAFCSEERGSIHLWKLLALF